MSDLIRVVHGKQRDAIEAMIDIFGDNSNAILNALHEMSVRVALLSGVTPENFADGVKHHWDVVVNAINAEAP